MRTIGPFVSSTDFIALSTALTIANTDIKLKKNGATAVNKNSGGATADGTTGMYNVTFDATDTNTVGELMVSVKMTGALVWFATYHVLTAAAYDEIYASTATGYIVDQPVNVTKWAGSATAAGNIVLKNTLAKTTDITGFNDISAANVQTELGTYGALKPTVAARTLDVSAGGEAGIDWANIGTPATAQNLSATTISTSQAVASVTNPVALTSAYDAAKLAAPAGAAMTLTAGERTTTAGVIWNVLTSALTTAGSIGKLLVDNLNATVSSAVGDTPGTTTLLSRIASTLNITAGKVDVNDKTGFALTAAYDAAKTAAAPGAAMTLTSGERTTTAGVIWNTLTSALTTAGSIGKLLVDNIDAKISSMTGGGGGGADPWLTPLPGSYASGTAGNILGNRLDAAVSTRATPGAAMSLTSDYDASKTAAQVGSAMTLTSTERTSVASVVWSMLTSALTTVGSIGKLLVDNLDAKISSVASSVDPWSQLLPGSYPANSAGSLIGNNLDVKVSTRLATTGYTVPPTANQNAVATRDIDNTNPATNSLGAAINRAASAGDPWSTILPGSYPAGTAGKLMSDNLDAKVSTRAQDGAAMTLTTSERNAVAAAVRDVSNSTPAAGSLGADVKAGKDPWTTLVPGSYAAGTAGNILGNRLDVQVSSRLAGSVYIFPPDANLIATTVRDVNNQTPAANSLGAAINAAASAGDPWGTQLPGAYASGTAGNIVGTRIDALISSRFPTANYTVPPTKEVIAIAVRDVSNAAPASGSLGEAINRAASAGDPWSTILPGAYGAGTAGKLMGDNLDAKVSTRLPTSLYTVPPNVTDIANSVRDVDNRTPAPNSLGAAVNSAASAGDPWATVIPGTYGPNTAGKIIGSNLDQTVSSRLAANNYVVPPTIQTIAVAVRDVDNTNPAANSLGAGINRAASAGDPWSAQLPNPIYGAGTAGKLISDTMYALIASRLAASAYVIPPNVSQIGVAVRDTDNTSPLPGSLGDKVNSAASAGDPWATNLPGSYAAGTAGSMIGNNVDAKISTRLPTSSYVAAPGIQQIAEGVRDIDNTTPASNSLGAAVNVSAIAGDPWTKVLPGSYGAGTAGKLVGDNVDAKISTRSTYAGTDTPGTTTLLGRVPSSLTVTNGKVDVNDKTGFSLDSSYDKAKTAAQPGDAMALTSTERTTLSSAIWQYLTSFMSSAGTIGKLLVDQLNVSVGSRLATSSYVAADNAGIAAIKLKTDTIPPNPALVTDVPTVGQIAAGVRDISNATPAAGSIGADIKAGAQVTDPWAISVPGAYASGTAGNVLGTRLDAQVSTRLPTANIALNSGMVTVGTNNDKAGYSLASGQASSVADEILKRDWQLVGGEAAYSVLNALRFLRDSWEVKPDGTLVVYKENGQIAWTKSVNADPDAQPIIGVQ